MKRYSTPIIAILISFVCAMIVCVVAATWIIAAPTEEFKPTGMITVTYYIDSGNNSEQSEIIYKKYDDNDETVIELPTSVERATDDEYSLDGWYYTDTYTTKVTEEITVGWLKEHGNDLSLYARKNFNANYDVSENAILADYRENITRPQDEKTYHIGNEIQMPEDLSVTGYDFNGWKVEGDETFYKHNNNYVIQDLELSQLAPSTINFVAQWQAIDYTVTYSHGVFGDAKVTDETPDEEIKLPQDAAKYNIGASVKINEEIPTRVGFNFMGWKLNADSSSDTTFKYDSEKGFSSTSFKITAELIKALGENNTEFTLTAVWKKVPKKVVLHGNGGTFETANSYAKSGVMPLADNDTSDRIERTLVIDDPLIDTNEFTVTSKGYTLVGWIITSDNSVNAQQYTVLHRELFIAAGNENIEITAVWQAIPYTVVFDNGGHGEQPESIINVTLENDKNTITLPKLTATGYTFSGWQYSDKLYTADSVTFDESMIPANGTTLTFTAQWTAIKYTVNVNPVFGTVTGLPSTLSLEEGENTITLPQLSAIGYTFDGWKVTFGNYTYEWKISENTLTNFVFELNEKIIEDSGYLYASGTITFTAQWTAIEYTVVFDNGGHGEQPEIINVTLENDKNTITLSQLTATGYTFVGWQYSDKLYTEDSVTFDESMIPANGTTLTFTTKWDADGYEAVFVTAHGTEPQKVVLTLEEGHNTITLPQLSATGYEFNGWKVKYANGAEAEISGIYKLTEAIITENSLTKGSTITFTAQWTTIEYNVNVEPVFGTVNGLPSTLSLDSPTITLPKLSEIGYEFLGWEASVGSVTNDQNGYSYTLTETIISDNKITKDSVITFTAKWDPKTYTIEFVDDIGKNTQTVESISISDRLAIPRPTVEPAGYKFLGWGYSNEEVVLGKEQAQVRFEKEFVQSYLNATGQKADTFTLIFYAVWEELDKIHVSFMAYGLIVDERYVVVGGTLSDFPEIISLKDGYELTGWFDQEVGGKQYTSETVFPTDVTEIILYAQWQAIQYSITYHIDSNISTVSYTIEDSAVTLLVPATVVGYKFDGWYLTDEYSGTIYSGTLSGEELFNALKGNHDLYGRWKKADYTVMYHGGVIGNAQNIPADRNTYQIGDAIAISQQEPNCTGYSFTGWLVAGDDTLYKYGTANNSLTITEDIINALNGKTVITLVAQWTAINYKVAYDLAGGEINGNNTYIDNGIYTVDGSVGSDTIVFPDEPIKAGSAFKGWVIIFNGTHNYKDYVEVEVSAVAGYAVEIGGALTITFTATWELENQTMVIFNLNDGSNQSDSRVVDENGIVTDWPVNPEWRGHTFIGWYDENGNKYTSASKFNTDKDTNLYAHWKLIVYLDKTIEMDYAERIVTVSNNAYLGTFTYTIPTNWNEFKTLVPNAVQFVDIDGNVIPLELNTNFTFSISAMNDGTYYYGTAVPGLTSWATAIVGSTYQATVALGWKASDEYVLYHNDTEWDRAINFSNQTCLIKYKTVQIGNTVNYEKGTWYTVEDALAKAGSNTILTAGRILEFPYSGTDANDKAVSGTYRYGSGIARTAFSALNPSITGYANASYAGGMINYDLSTKLRVPFANVNYDYDGKGGESSKVTASGQINSTLIIPKNVQLNINGTKGVLMIGGLIQSTGTVQNRGVVMNEGVINVNNGAKIGAYGYLKSETGSGKVIFNSGSTGIDVLKMYDWIGGANTLGISNTHKIFPINAYSVHNISCESIFYAGSALEAFWSVNMSLVGYKNADSDGAFKLIGKAGATNTLFRLESGYIVKKANGGEDATMTTEPVKNKSREDALTGYNGSNQTAGQFDVFELYGKVTDATVSITIYNVSMETKTTLALPIGYMDIVVGNDGKGNAGDLTLSAASYRFMPGSSLTVEDGANLTVGPNATVYFYTFDDCDEDQNYECYPSSDRNDGYYSFTQKYCKNKVDAEFIVNGTATINGYLGGTALTEGSTGKLIINGTASGTIDHISYLKYVRTGSTVRTTTRTTDATGEIMLATGGAEVQKFQKGVTYIAMDGVWARMASYTINYNANGGTLTGAASETYSVLLGNTVNINSIDTTDPLRNHYEFRGWYFDEAFTKPVEDGYTFIAGTVSEITVYAKWEAIEYSIHYEMVFDEGTGATADCSKLPQTFTMDNGSVSFNETLLGSIDGYVFVGFYTDASCAPAFEISEISVAELIKLLREGSVTIYVFWRDASSKEFTINYVNEKEVEGIGNKFNTHTDTVLQSNNSYQLWMPNGFTAASIYDDKSISHDFIGWYLIYNGEEKIVETLADIVELFKDASETNIEITLYAKWQAKLKIIFRDDVRNFYNETYHHAGDIINVTPIALGYNNTGDTDTNERTYFVGWSIQGDAVNVFTETYNVPESYIGAEITLTAYRVDKVQVKFEAIAGFKGYSGWHMAGDVLDNEKIGFNLSYTTDPDNNTNEYYFKGWQKDGTYYLNGYTVLKSDSGTVILIAAIEQRTLLNVNISSSGGTATASLTYTNSSGVKVTINSNGNYYLSEGVVVSYTIKAQQGSFGSASWSITINGQTYKSGGSSSSDQTGTFTMPAPGNTGVIVTVTSSCIAEGTLITLADGTQKKVEDLQVGDMLLVFNHETGNYESAPLLFNLHANNPAEVNRIINLKFSDGTILRIVGRHGLFDLTLNKYVFIDELSMQDYIGHKFANTTQVDGVFVSGEVELISVYITEEYVRYYSPISVMHMNVVAEGLLTVTMLNGLDEGLFNAFEYGDGMKYDEAKMQADIEEYGLYTYEDFKDLIPEELFNALPWKYLKVAVGKGYITWEAILWNIDYIFNSGQAY